MIELCILVKNKNKIHFKNKSVNNVMAPEAVNLNEHFGCFSRHYY